MANDVPARPQGPIFEFESSDSLAQLMVWFAPVAGGGVLAWLAMDLGGMWAIAAIAVVCLLLTSGLRSRIVVLSGKVTVSRKWFCVTYWSHSARCIEDISFGGDWGLDDGAVGVVLRMAGKEVHVGNSKNMHYLFERLSEVAYSGSSSGERP